MTTRKTASRNETKPKAKSKAKKQTGARPVSELYKGLSKERREKIEIGTRILIMEYELLTALRKTRQLTQKEIAAIMEIGQSAISKIEHQDDILVRTLERYVKALGGELEISVKFPDATISMGNFTRRPVTSVASR
jgi:ribosome-binding protein aMBF1 (putative translation factor)